MYKLDRFSRSTKQLIDALERFEELGIDFASYSDDINTTSAQGRFFFHVISAFAEFERAIISERVKSGLIAARKKGKRLGKAPAEFDVAKAKKLRAEGLSYRKIAQELGGNVHFTTIQHRLTGRAK